jgi:tetratricopeptide (TPR) repeat protein
MMRAWRSLVLVMLGVGLGCAGPAPVVESERPSAPPPQPVEQPADDVVVTPLTDEPNAPVPLAEQLPESATAVNPAVVALLDSAGKQSRAGEYDTAAATLERALEIEPTNAWLWHRLALIRLDQGAHRQAAGLAARSNSFAVADEKLQAENWSLIAEARKRLGDAAGAKEAERMAKQLSP